MDGDDNDEEVHIRIAIDGAFESIPVIKFELRRSMDRETAYNDTSERLRQIGPQWISDDQRVCGYDPMRFVLRPNPGVCLDDFEALLRETFERTEVTRVTSHHERNRTEWRQGKLDYRAIKRGIAEHASYTAAMTLTNISRPIADRNDDDTAVAAATATTTTTPLSPSLVRVIQLGDVQEFPTTSGDCCSFPVGADLYQSHYLVIPPGQSVTGRVIWLSLEEREERAMDLFVRSQSGSVIPPPVRVIEGLECFREE